jgi:sugar/nucleoside kinase (ribokinase family)
MTDILCIGQLAADLLVRPVDFVDFGSDTQRVEVIDLQNGGDCLNVAIGMKRLGHRVGFVGKVGLDPFGDFLVRVIDSAGIERRGLRRTDQAGTCSVLVLINSAGERTFFYRGGTNDLFGLEDVDLRLVEETSAVYVGGTYLLPRFDGDGAATVFARARAQGKITAMDVTWDVEGRWLTVIEPCLPHLSYFLPSIKEAERITGCQKPETMAAFLQDRGVENVVIKLGEKGCYVKPPRDKGFFVEAFYVQAVDTTGAGDSFVAGFLSGVLGNWDLYRCGRFGCAVAALNVQRVGATAGIPTHDEAMQFMEQR